MPQTRISGQGTPSNFVFTEGFGKSTKGVFDATGFKAPAQAQWPRVYP
jgi:hypothetical protein